MISPPNLLYRDCQVWDLQQNTMTMKMQRKAVHTQIQEHQVAEENGLVTLQRVKQAEEEKKKMENSMEQKKEDYSVVTKSTPFKLAVPCSVICVFGATDRRH